MTRSSVAVLFLFVGSLATGCMPVEDETADTVGEEPEGHSVSSEQENVGEAVAAASPNDIRWAIQHGAASAACAAASPENDSSSAHAVIPKPSGGTCAGACLANTGGVYKYCRTSIAVGEILPTQATSYTQVISRNYRYSCSAGSGGLDEVLGLGVDPGTVYTAYCCCYY